MSMIVHVAMMWMGAAALCATAWASPATAPTYVVGSNSGGPVGGWWNVSHKYVGQGGSTSFTALETTYAEFVQVENETRSMCTAAEPCSFGAGPLQRKLLNTLSFSLEFALHVDDLNPLKYAEVTEPQAICRLQGYYPFCDNPYRDQDGTDTTHPAFIEYALLPRPLTDDEATRAPARA